ncbi:MAG: DNA polymerase III subunit epsilon [Alphaproteobacteria bacterium]|nr:DNA polymerase III subunit epsilon [Alphaproteobacteria bacterium]
MREVVLDTETTGLDPYDGHRVIEIGCVELIDHLPSGRHFQAYLNPGRPVADSHRVHGISDEFLLDKPTFDRVVDEFMEFLADAPLVIHNASFDLKFLNAELHRIQRKPIPYARAIDTIEIAKIKLPGARYSLDELCRRFGVDLSGRETHGALKDALLTAQVYLELVGGRQKTLVLSPVDSSSAASEIASYPPRPTPLPDLVSSAELAAHLAFVARELGGNAIWKRLPAEPAAPASVSSYA